MALDLVSAAPHFCLVIVSVFNWSPNGHVRLIELRFALPTQFGFDSPIFKKGNIMSQETASTLMVIMISSGRIIAIFRQLK